MPKTFIKTLVYIKIEARGEELGNGYSENSLHAKHEYIYVKISMDIISL